MASGSTMGVGAIVATYLATAVGAVTATGKLCRVYPISVVYQCIFVFCIRRFYRVCCHENGCYDKKSDICFKILFCPNYYINQ